MWRPVTLPGNRMSPQATAGLDRWSSKTELGLQTVLIRNGLRWISIHGSPLVLGWEGDLPRFARFASWIAAKQSGSWPTVPHQGQDALGHGQAGDEGAEQGIRAQIAQVV